jgi:hypothetical protein
MSVDYVDPVAVLLFQQETVSGIRMRGSICLRHPGHDQCYGRCGFRGDHQRCRATPSAITSAGTVASPSVTVAPMLLGGNSVFSKTCLHVTRSESVVWARWKS